MVLPRLEVGSGRGRGSGVRRTLKSEYHTLLCDSYKMWMSRSFQGLDNLSFSVMQLPRAKKKEKKGTNRPMVPSFVYQICYRRNNAYTRDKCLFTFVH